MYRSRWNLSFSSCSIQTVSHTLAIYRVQAPFSKFYSEEDKAVLWDDATPVRDLFPSNTAFPRQTK